ncbi:MAG: GDP-L-fucose synthase [Rikenellaceae bacterium]
MQKHSKIYIAGHRGLVGSAIWRNLESKGYTNLVGRTHTQLDLLDSCAVKDFFDKEEPEYVILAAAKVGGIMANNTLRADFIYENLQIQQNVIGESFRHNVKKLLFLGSTCIYPRECPQPIKEEYLLTGTLEATNEPYALAKIAGLKMCESFNRQYGTNYISVMPTNLYGERDNFNLETSHVLPAMLRKVHLASALERGDWTTIRKDLSARPVEGIEGTSSKEDITALLSKYGINAKSLELWGTGTPLREFLWSDDMADASVHILEHCNWEDTHSHINIGTGKEITISALSALVKETVGYKGTIKFDTTKPDGTMRKLTDVSKLHSLGWTHKVELQEGISRLYNWYTSTL